MSGPTARERERFVRDVSQKKYVNVMKQLSAVRAALTHPRARRPFFPVSARAACASHLVLCLCPHMHVQGADPNADWKGMLPLRTAVLISDPEMVALLRTQGADPKQQPKMRVKNSDGDETDEVVLGKSARELAVDMANDEANPLHRDGQTMLRIVDDMEEARRRVVALQSRLEEEIAAEMRGASRNIAIFFVGAVVFGYLFLQQHGDAGEDPREL
jgi:hypothetical protein